MWVALISENWDAMHNGFNDHRNSKTSVISWQILKLKFMGNFRHQYNYALLLFASRQPRFYNQTTFTSLHLVIYLFFQVISSAVRFIHIFRFVQFNIQNFWFQSLRSRGFKKNCPMTSMAFERIVYKFCMLSSWNILMESNEMSGILDGYFIH